MRLVTSVILALGVAASVHASWTIPENQPDGVYVVSVDEAGKSVHKKVDSLQVAARAPERRMNSAKFSPRSELFPRETYSITCYGYYLGHSDADSAGSNLGSQCGSNGVVGGHKSFYAKSGGAVAYFCNKSSGSNTCYSWEVTDALVSKGPAICGNYAAVDVRFVNKQGAYGQQQASASFC